jgi:hypothetical protein
MKQLANKASFLHWLPVEPEDGGDMFLRSVGLHGVIAQKLDLPTTDAFIKNVIVQFQF